MSRRSQSRRRRSYGRRQHEVRERHDQGPREISWDGRPSDVDWTMVDLDDDPRHATDDGMGGFVR